MDNTEALENTSWKSKLLRFKQKFAGKGAKNANEIRVRRRRAMVQALTKRLPLIKLFLFFVGYLWMIAIPLPQLGRDTYIDENALQPAQVSTEWNWGDVHNADRYLAQLEQLRDSNATSEQRALYVTHEFQKMGMAASTQKYTFSVANQIIQGTNAYAISSSPRASGNEAMVIAASWISRQGEGQGELNLRGISTILALANFLKRYSLWAKDIVFVVSDGYLEGMQAWINAYHGETQNNLHAEELAYSSGVIWNALAIDYACHSFSHLGVFHEGVNGLLPNQDLINSFERISRFTGGVPVVMYDHLDPQSAPPVYPSWIPQFIQSNSLFENYVYQAKNVARHVGYQARGRASGIHGLFHRHRIDAFTIYAICATGPHGFHALGRIIESTLRTMNNLLERLHASFFFYILTSPFHFNKIGGYVPSVVLISVAMMFQGLSVWVDAGWIRDVSSLAEKSTAKPTWVKRKRPLLAVLTTMIATHVLGTLLFAVVSSTYVLQNIKILSPLVFTAFSTLPLAALALAPKSAVDAAPFSTLLKALNLCFASTIISITSVLNFSFALWLAILLGIPLSVSAPSTSWGSRFGGYSAYALLALGWLLFFPEETKSALWNWEILSAWFAPVICIVYVPLVLQAGIATLLSR